MASWRSAALGSVSQRWSQAGVGEYPKAAVFIEVDHDGLAGATAQQEGHDAVVAGGGMALAAGLAVDHQGACGTGRACRGTRLMDRGVGHGHIFARGCDSPACEG